MVGGSEEGRVSRRGHARDRDLDVRHARRVSFTVDHAANKPAARINAFDPDVDRLALRFDT